jgi:hypothetical protein
MVLAMAAVMALAAPLRAGQIDNPEYKAWAKFKVGSSRTLTGAHGGGASFVATGSSSLSTLLAITSDKVTIKGDVPIFGYGPITARIDEKDIKYIGEENVQAMGKTFKCKVYTLPKKTWNAATGGQKSSQLKKWINDEVPGGLVKEENAISEPGPSPDLQYHRTETFLLTAYEVK